MKVRTEWFKDGWMLGIQYFYPYPPWRPCFPTQIIFGIGRKKIIISIGKTVLDEPS